MVHVDEEVRGLWPGRNSGPRHWENRESTHPTGSITYHSPEQERGGRNRTGHVIQPHHVTSYPASGLHTAQASLRHRLHRAKSWLLRPGSGPRECSAWSQEPGTWDAWHSGRKTRRSAGAEIPQSGPGHPHAGALAVGGFR